MKTIIPAQPGFFVADRNGELVPVIAWEINDNPSSIWPITPRGVAPGAITYFREDGSVIWRGV